MESTGKVIAVLPLQSGFSQATGKEWQTQTFVIQTGDIIPKKQAFEVFGADRIQQIMPKEGQLVTVSFDLESREFNGRWFTSARAWRVAEPQAAAPAAQPMPQVPQAAPQPISQAAAPQAPQGNTELPF